MNELIDKLILRIFFTAFICIILYIYKYAHSFLYPSFRKQLFKRFYPSKNAPDTLHLFSRILGIGIIFSEFHFYMSDGILLALFDFFIQSILVFFIYLVSIYIVESIVLYNFEYADEVLKRRNFTYSLISFSHAIGLAYILKVVLAVSNDSVIMLFFLWLFAIVIMGFATKSYPILSKLSFNRLVVQKNMSVAISYIGLFWGWCILISSSLEHPLNDIRWYAVQAILKLLLSLIIFPIFKKGLIWIYKIQDDLGSESSEIKNDAIETGIGYGVYEGVIFFASCFLTTVITGHINFGTFYPIN